MKITWLHSITERSLQCQTANLNLYWNKESNFYYRGWFFSQLPFIFLHTPVIVFESLHVWVLMIKICSIWHYFLNNFSIHFFFFYIFVLYWSCYSSLFSPLPIFPLSYKDLSLSLSPVPSLGSDRHHIVKL